MKKLLLAVPCAIALITATALPSLAAVNCGIINKDLALGRKPEDIAERMGISVAEVQACKEKGTGTTADAPAAPKSSAAPQGAAPPAQGK